MKSRCLLKIVFFCSLLIITSPASAYIGPGGGISAIGTIIAAIAAVFVVLFGFIWYPVKRLLKKMRPPKEDDENEGDAT